jgi:hypothetical protein
LQHFADYKVEPCSNSLAKQHSLPEDMKEANEIKDFLGHLVKAFSLRNRLTRWDTLGAPPGRRLVFRVPENFLASGYRGHHRIHRKWIT